MSLPDDDDLDLIGQDFIAGGKIIFVPRPDAGFTDRFQLDLDFDEMGIDPEEEIELRLMRARQR